ATVSAFRGVCETWNPGANRRRWETHSGSVHTQEISPDRNAQIGVKIPPAIFTLLDQRPLLIAIAGPNGAGKSTFYQSHLATAGLSFVNADNIAREMGIGSYAAANLTAALRRRYIEERRSFVFETVFSDP